MSLLEVIFMGLIQGLTEFLPVSSSGHLAIFKNIFHINTDTGLLFDVLLHLGTLLAVFVAYFKDIKRLVVEGIGIMMDTGYNIGAFFSNLSGRRKLYRRVICSAYRKFVLLIVIATIPTGILGYVGRDLIREAGNGLLIPGVCLIVTAILLFISDYAKDREKRIKNITYNNAFVIGMCQGIATLPGISRSGMTITACLLSGFSRKLAVKFSFLMSIPAILGALVLELKDIGSTDLVAGEIGKYIIGMLVAAVIGYICIKTMLVIVRGKKFKYFAIYCLAAGIIAIVGSYLVV